MYVSTHTHGKLPLCRYKAILAQQIIDIVDTSEEGLAFFFFFFQATLAGDTVVEQNNPPTCHLIELNKLKKILKLCISNLRLSGHFGFTPSRESSASWGGGESKVTFLLTQQHAVVNFHFHSHPSGATKRRFISQLQM